jgi:hypothetical protein
MQTDSDIESQLAGESYRGPRTWQGQPLAPLSRGLRNLHRKGLSRGDTDDFHDVVFVHILRSAYAVTDDARIAQRQALILATDDVPAWRTSISLLMDDLSDEAIAEARTLAEDLLGLVAKAQTSPVEKKTEPVDIVATIPTTMPSPSPNSPAPSDGSATPSSGT